MKYEFEDLDEREVSPELRNARYKCIRKYRRAGISDKDICRKISEEFAIKYKISDLQNDMKAIIDDWVAWRSNNPEYLQMEEYFKRQELIDECWDSFRQSKDKAIETITVTDANGNIVKIQTKEYKPIGDKRWLELIAEQYRIQAEIMGTLKKIDTIDSKIDTSGANIKSIKAIVQKLRPMNIETYDEEDA